MSILYGASYTFFTEQKKIWKVHPVTRMIIIIVITLFLQYMHVANDAVDHNQLYMNHCYYNRHIIHYKLTR